MIHKVLFFGCTVFLVPAFIACQSPAPPPGESASESPAPPLPVELSPSERLDAIRSNLEEVKTELNDRGEYNCCVQPACNWCAIHEGNCECFNNLQEGEDVCPGCGLGWHNGRGAIDGVEPSSVKWDITHEHAEGAHEH